MTAVSKFLVLLAIFLLASYANAFVSLGSAAGTQIWINHVIQLEEPMSNQTKIPACESTCKPTTDQMNDQTTKQLRLVALLPDNQSSKRVTFSNQVQDIEIQSKLPDLSQTQPNKRQMPNIINLDSSGLQHSSWKEVLSWRDKIYSHSTTSFKQINRGSKHACLVLFSSFCTVGTELTHGAYSLQDNLISCSKFSYAIDSYHRVNLLYDGTINCFFTLTLSSTALNKTFTYKQALQEADYHEFVKAMIHEVNDHESQTHWTLTKRCELPLRTKTNNALSFSSKSASALQLVVASVANKFSKGSTQPSRHKFE
jgi:hypothetical protein